MYTTVRVIIHESFEPSVRYDFVVSDAGWTCYRSAGPMEEMSSNVCDREARGTPQPTPAPELAAHMERLFAVRVPLMPRLRPLHTFQGGIKSLAYVDIAVADGGTYELTLYGVIQSIQHFSWRTGHPPPGWEPLELVIGELADFVEDHARDEAT